jgi:hypothetical protein
LEFFENLQFFPKKLLPQCENSPNKKHYYSWCFHIHLVFSWIFLIRYILFIHFSIQLEPLASLDFKGWPSLKSYTKLNSHFHIHLVQP